MKLFAPLLSLALLGCATAAQEKAVAFKQGMSQLSASAYACHSEIDNDPQFAPIFLHMPLDAAQKLKPTMSQLTEEVIPSLAEATLMVRYQDATSICREQFISGLTKFDLGMAEAFESAQASVSAIFVPLIERQETWGAANRALIDAKAKGASMVRQARADLHARLGAENAEELQNRAAIASAIGAAAGAAIQYNQNERLISAINKY